jgi:hypothetical protein
MGAVAMSQEFDDVTHAFAEANCDRRMIMISKRQ